MIHISLSENIAQFVSDENYQKRFHTHGQQGNQRFYQYCTKAAKFNWLHHPSKFAESAREMRQLREGEREGEPRTSDRAAC